MSTLKVDTYLTRGGASEIAIDKLKGVTAAGSMLVVGEGGTNTTNLQQGLAKFWVNFNGTGTIAARDSLNFSSLTDNGTGDYTVNFSNSMTNVNYASLTCSDATNFSQLGSVATRVKASANIQLYAAVVVGTPGSSARTLFDLENVNVAILGDLA